MERGIEVAERDHGLHAELMALVEHRVVERQAFLVGLGVVAIGEDAAPRDGHAENLEAHTGDLSQLLLVAMVEIDAAALRKVELLGVRFHLGEGLGRYRVMRQVILDAATVGLL